MADDKHKSFLEMVGEAMREVAVLVAVFFMLDNIIEEAGYSIQTSVIVLAACFATFALGVTMEI